MTAERLRGPGEAQRTGEVAPQDVRVGRVRDEAEVAVGADQGHALGTPPHYVPGTLLRDRDDGAEVAEGRAHVVDPARARTGTAGSGRGAR